MEGIYDGAILDYAVHIHFAMDGIYDEAHCRLCYVYFAMDPMVFMMKPIENYAIYVNVAMDGIYDGAHCRLCYVCMFCYGQYL